MKPFAKAVSLEEDWCDDGIFEVHENSKFWRAGGVSLRHMRANQNSLLEFGMIIFRQKKKHAVAPTSRPFFLQLAIHIMTGDLTDSSVRTIDSNDKKEKAPPSSSKTAATEEDRNEKTQSTDASPPQPPQEEKEPIDYNPRLLGYAYILLASLVNFSSVSNVPGEQREAFWYLSIAFGVLTFCISSLIIIQDWAQPWIKLFTPIQEVREGYAEGCLLLFMVVWWIVGVAYITRPGGIAYVASNIWYSAWLSLFACCFTLNEWSASKDILSLEEIISISPTLVYWWILFFSACIVFGSCFDIIIRYNQPWNDFQDASFGLALGLVSMVISFTMILIQYDFLTACQCEEGGWTELFTSFFLILVWIIGLAIM